MGLVLAGRHLGVALTGEEFPLGHVGLACTHDLAALHVLLRYVLRRLRPHGLLLFPVLEEALLNDLVRGAHNLLRILLALWIRVVSVFRVALEIPLLLHLLASARLPGGRSIAIEVVDEVLRVDGLGCVGGAPENEAASVALPREPLDLPFDRLMDEVLAAAVPLLRCRELLRVLLHVLLVELEGRSVSVYRLRSLLVRIGQAHRDGVAADRVASRVELLHARRPVEDSGLVELVAAVVAHLRVALALEAHRHLAFLHIRVSSDPPWLLMPVMNLSLLHIHLLP